MYFPLDYPIPFRDTDINIPSLRDFLFEVRDRKDVYKKESLREDPLATGWRNDDLSSSSLRTGELLWLYGDGIVHYYNLEQYLST